MISIDISKKSSSDDGTEDGNALWGEVVRDIKPLKKKKTAPDAPSLPKVQRRISEVPKVPLPVAKTRVPGDQEVDRRTAEKLKKGQYQIDVTLDLHGLTQIAAHHKLLETIRRSYARGHRCVLVITGKGRGEGQGVLKKRVPEWLQDEVLRSVVLKIQGAKPEHGGGGALYVLLRRQRPEN